MDAPSNQRPAGDYTRNDVLFGRGGGINVHPGKCFVIWINVYSILSIVKISVVLISYYHLSSSLYIMNVTLIFQVIDDSEI